MFGLTRLRTITNAARERRRRAQAHKILAGLPPELKKDIGWPSAARIQASYYRQPSQTRHN